MTTDANQLIARLEVRMRDYERKMERAAAITRRRTAQIERRFKETNRSATAQMVSLGRAIGPALAPLTGVLSVAGITRGVRSAVSSLSNLGKQARDTGIDVEELQGLMRGFARNTRISEDQSVAAFERFNRRIGEAVNGMGPLNATLERHGISVRRANGEMKSQAELLRDVADAIRRTSNEQERAAIAQAAFGDVGRQMAAELAKGSDGLDAMMRDASEAGDVIDRDLIQRAELLDDKFDELTRKAGTFFKTLAVGMVGGGIETSQDVLERLFGSLDRARFALGDDLTDQLLAERDAIDQVGGSLEDVADRAESARARTDDLIRTIDELAGRMRDLGDNAAADAMMAIADDINDADIAFRDGEISAERFTEKVREGGDAAFDTANAVRDIDTATLGRVIQAVNALAGALRGAQVAAAGLNAELGNQPQSSLSIREQAIAESGAAREALRDFVNEEQRLASRTREQIALEGELSRVQRRARDEGVALTDAQARAQAALNLQLQAAAAGGGGGGGGRGGGGGGGGGGGAAQQSDFERAVETIRDRTAALEAEAAALVLAAASGREYGDTIRYAQERARLLHAAQKDGLAITPELEEAVDRMAEAYARAGDAASTAADAIRQAESDARSGAQALSGLFLSIRGGSDSARRALGSLLAQMAAAQMTRGLMGMPGMGFIGSLLRPFDVGGYTGDGGTHEPRGVVHGGEYVFSKRATQALGVDRLEALHRAGKGYAGGGLVGGVGSAGSALDTLSALTAQFHGQPRGFASGGGGQGPARVELAVDVSVDDDGRLRVIAEESGARAALPVALRVTQSAMAENRRALPGQLRELDQTGR